MDWKTIDLSLLPIVKQWAIGQQYILCFDRETQFYNFRHLVTFKQYHSDTNYIYLDVNEVSPQTNMKYSNNMLWNMEHILMYDFIQYT